MIRTQTEPEKYCELFQSNRFLSLQLYNLKNQGKMSWCSDLKGAKRCSHSTRRKMS